MANATDINHLHRTITQIIDDECGEDCPRPSRLKALLHPSIADTGGIPRHRVCRLGFCCGDGWRVRYHLHSSEYGRRTREEITADQARLLWHQIRGTDQAIYEYVSACECGETT